MRNGFLFILSCLLSVQVMAIDASISYARFFSPQGNYLEVYLHVIGQSVSPTEVTDSTVQGAVNVLILFEQEGTIVKYDHYRLNSPESERVVDFVDIKRYGLANGDYTLAVLVEDAADSTNVREYRTDFNIQFNEQGLQQSDIQLLASARQGEEGSPFVKHGLLLEPLPYHFYGRGANVLSFYHEIYNSEQAIGDVFVATYKIDQLSNQTENTLIIGHKRQDPAAINPIVQQVDISELPSGNYRLNLEIRNRAREVIGTKSVYFQRSNPLVDAEQLETALASVSLDDEFVGDMSKEELRYSLLAIVPHMPQGDVEMVDIIMKKDSLNAQKSYLYSFWARQNPANPQIAHDEYMEVAKAVDDLFQSGFRNGFETDRGYVYLKYGQPNDIVRNETEPSAPPYEIWSYDNIDRTNQNNVRFIFYNPSLAADDFVLLHSDVIGEIQNPQWQMELYRDAPGEHPDDYFMGEEVQDNIGRRARRLLRDF